MDAAVKTILDRIPAWPEEDQEELARLALEIEARRTGVYPLSGDEKASIAAARRSGIACDDAVSAFWERHGTT